MVNKPKRGKMFSHSGAVVYPGNGTPTVKDMAIALMREGRYAGAGVRWYPVGLHTFVVCDLLPDRLKFHGLVHDTPECVTGDLPKPIKTEAIEAFEKWLLKKFYKRAFRVPYPTKAERAEVKVADNRAKHGESHSVGTRVLRTIYPQDWDAQALTQLYAKKYPVTDLVKENGRAVKEFTRRYKEYKKLL
jgi:hypothetical protein